MAPTAIVATGSPELTSSWRSCPTLGQASRRQSGSELRRCQGRQARTHAKSLEQRGRRRAGSGQTPQMSVNIEPASACGGGGRVEVADEGGGRQSRQAPPVEHERLYGLVEWCGACEQLPRDSLQAACRRLRRRGQRQHLTRRGAAGDAPDPGCLHHSRIEAQPGAPCRASPLYRLFALARGVVIV